MLQHSLHTIVLMLNLISSQRAALLVFIFANFSLKTI